MLRGRHTIILAVILLALQTTAPSWGQTEQTQGKGSNADAGRLLAALEKSGYNYRKAGDGIWVVTLAGKNIKDIDIAVTSVEDSVLLQTQVVERKAIVRKEALFIKLLELNHEYDTAKFALSEEMLYARIDLHSRLVDAEELKHLINQLALFVDESYPQIKPLLGAK